MQTNKRFLVLAFVLALSACSNVPPLPPVDVTWLSTQAARAAQEGMLEPATIKRDAAYAAKFRVGREFYTVTTYAPIVLATNGYGDEKSVSAIRFSAARDSLEIFTRNPQNGEAYRASVPLENANYWPEFSFPMIRGNRVELVPMQVVNLIRKPDNADPVRGAREYLQRGMPNVDLPQFTEIPSDGPNVIAGDR